MIVLAIDPGNVQSAWVAYDMQRNIILGKAIVPNEDLVAQLRDGVMHIDGDMVTPTILAVEMIKSYGMPMGDTCLMTCVWIGRFIEAWSYDFELLPRKTIVTHICGSANAGDSNVRQGLINRFSGTRPIGGGKTPEIGTKRKPGPLYGFSRDMWAALAVALCYADNVETVDDFLT